MHSKTSRDPLAPIEFVTAFALGVLGFLLVTTAVFSVVDPKHWHFGRDTCVQVDAGSGVVLPLASEFSSAGPSQDEGPQFSTSTLVLKPVPNDVKVDPQFLSVCANHPTRYQARLNEVPTIAGTAAVFGFLGFVLLLTRRARQRGLFNPTVARGLTRLGGGLFVLCGVVGAVNEWAHIHLLRAMLPGIERTWANNSWHVLTSAWPGWGVVFVSAGIVTLGRVLTHAVQLQEEVDATV